MKPNNQNPRFVGAIEGLSKSNHSYDITREIYEKARGRWVEILESCGINPNFLTNQHGPCPICGGKDRFRFDDKEQGMFYCNKCGSGRGIKLIMLFHNCSYRDAIDRVARQLRIHTGIYQSRRSQRMNVYSTLSYFETSKRCQEIKNVLRSSHFIITGDPVDQYLKLRGLELSPAPKILRYHPALAYYEGKVLIGMYQAMIGIITDHNNKCVSLHRTYLDNGYKAAVPKPKKLMTPKFPGATKGAAIRLFEPKNDTLSVAEGIETALAFHISTKLPIWATISAWGMENIILPASVKNIVIVADNDISGTGQNAAIALSKRLIKEGRKVKRVMPSKIGCDFNDILLEKKP